MNKSKQNFKSMEHKRYRVDTWLCSMYLAAKEIGFKVFDENQEIEYMALESEIFNQLMEFEHYKKYYRAVEGKSKQAANRVWEVKKGESHG